LGITQLIARIRWRTRLQERVADRHGLQVTVCHHPTGTWKWNPVEHRLSGPVNINRAGQPLRSLEFLTGWVRGTEVGGVGATASLDDPTERNGRERRTVKRAGLTSQVDVDKFSSSWHCSPKKGITVENSGISLQKIPLAIILGA